MSAITVETICQDFKNAIESVVEDEDFIVDIHLTADSVIGNDLQLDSVEIVRTFDYFLKKYPDAPFVDWFSSLDIAKIQTLTVQDLTTFLQEYY